MRCYPDCRVHNPFDLALVAANGVDMIGMHAVHLDPYRYLGSQLGHRPLRGASTSTIAPPLASLEAESIVAMQRCMPRGMRQAIVLENPTSVAVLSSCLETYGMSQADPYLQFQHRITQQYVGQIKEIFEANIIASMGLAQNDFEEYFFHLEDILDPTVDFILLDLSKHQPDMLIGSDCGLLEMDKRALLRRWSGVLRSGKVRVMLADDTSIDRMRFYLRTLTEAGVPISGVDMQNAVEVHPSEQVFRVMCDEYSEYPAKIRKSPDLVERWGRFVSSQRLARRLSAPVGLVVHGQGVSRHSG
jgi:hypothetical protein